MIRTAEREVRMTLAEAKGLANELEVILGHTSLSAAIDEAVKLVEGICSSAGIEIWVDDDEEEN